MTNRLTKRTVDALKANGSDAVYWDGYLTGFGVRVRKSGRKIYVLQTRVDGRLRWFTIGPHGPLTVDEARTKALEILALARKGIDLREKPTTPAPMMSDLGKRFLEDYVPDHCKPSTLGEYRRSVELFINPVIGTLRVSEVQRKDIAELHHGLRKTPYQANRTLGVLSKMFSLAEVWGWRPDGTNPCRHVKRYKESPRERFLSEEETARLGEVLRDAEEEMPSAVAAFRLLLLTGCRMSEIRDLKWEHVKEDCIELRDSKTGPRVAPLGESARAVIDALPGPREPDAFLFPRYAEARGQSSLFACWRAVCADAELGRLRLHDLRHTAASQAVMAGENLPLVGRLLGHRRHRTTAGYAHLADGHLVEAAEKVGSLIAEAMNLRSEPSPSSPRAWRRYGL